MNTSQLKVRRGFVGFVLGFIFLILIIALLAPIYIGGKPTDKDIAMRGCRHYLMYAKSATTNKDFVFKQSEFLSFEKLSRFQTFFPTNSNFWIKTNFTANASTSELIFICKRQFYYPQSKNVFGCSYSRLTPAYVVGYSGGKTELISKEQFSSVDLTGFILLEP